MAKTTLRLFVFEEYARLVTSSRKNYPQLNRRSFQISTQAWADYNAACNPDIVTALSDIPFTPAPHSQKRTTKSIARSTAWLANLLRPTVVRREDAVSDPVSNGLSNVLVHMAGGAISQARRAFAESLIEDIEGIDADRLAPLRRLDDGVAGYVFDLVPLRSALSARPNANAVDDEEVGTTRREPQAHGAMGSLARAPAEGASQVDSAVLSEFFRASLRPLPAHKPRIANSARSPHEMLRLIRDVGVDLFDAHWAQRAADIGVALDFRFPIVANLTGSAGEDDADCPRPKTRLSGKADLGHNLYSARYANDHSRLASGFLDGQTYERRAAEGLPNLKLACPCAACSPCNSGSHILHSSADHISWDGQVAPNGFEPPFMRSYLHHLLHTHEMSAHTLLVMHNLHVLDAFFAGVREALEGGGAADFGQQVDRFSEVYDEDMVLFDEAKGDWAKVEMARGKGRLAREKIKQVESSTIITPVNV